MRFPVILCLAALAGSLSGGAWMDASAAAPAMDAWSNPTNPVVERFAGKRLDLWSLRAPVQKAVPAGRALNPVDRFLDAAMAGRGLEALPEADRRTLIRRVSLDLTGLLPAPEEVRDFERDGRPGAYERLVDRLLGSPRYGEQQARWWLDVVRYSDSNGFDWDEFRPRAWRFRDYVVRSFNADKPFARFVEEQLAGDEQVGGPPRDPAEQDALIATGFLRLGPHDNAAKLFNEQDRSRAELMADLVETTGSAFLGLTLSCCRCHDHKFDPLLQADHFRMRAFFEGVTFADELPLDLAPEQESIRRHNAGLDARIGEIEKERNALLDVVRQRLRAEREAGLTADERTLLATPEADRTADVKGRIDGVRKKVEPSDKEVKAGLTGEAKDRHAQLERDIAGVRRQRREFTLGLLMTDAPGEPPVTRVLFQGNHQTPREPVGPGFPSVLDPGVADIERAHNSSTSGRRRTLARWVTSPMNPWTWRVVVNRVWQQHFGVGLVATANDFGFSGTPPTHPELLDWLAVEFQRSGGSLKRLHRLLVTSAAYRRASGPPAPSDSENVWLSRRHPRRLSAEQLRDALLQVSGTLREASGGPPVWPDLPPEILQANPAFLDDNETRTKGWYPSAPEQQTVRSLYLVQKRTVRVPFMETFDLPENSVSCARRVESTVAPQALSLLNSPMAITVARALAGRVEREGGTDRVGRLFAVVLQRSPTAEERRIAQGLLDQRGLVEVCRAMINLNEFVYVD
jgi:hypothetical protein